MMALTKTNTMRGLVILHAADGIIPSFPLLKNNPRLSLQVDVYVFCLYVYRYVEMYN